MLQKSMGLFGADAHSVPVLVTDRLVLSGQRAEDFDDCAAMWADPEVTRFITGKPMTREEAWLRFLRAVGHWAAKGYGFWVVRERATGRFVGDVGLMDFQRELTPAYHGEPEAGWVLASWAHGKGYATEAVRAALAWAEAALAPPQIWCVIDPKNLPSLAVAQRCGFAEVARTTYNQHEVALLRRATGT